MKRIVLLMATPVLFGCTVTRNLPHQDILYNQDGKDCVYIENDVVHKKTISTITDDTIKETKNIYRTRSITYPNTKCEKVIDSDLKNAVNKITIR